MSESSKTETQHANLPYGNLMGRYALDSIMVRVRGLLRADALVRVDAELAALDAESLSTEEILTWLTATLSCWAVLRNRKEFAKQAIDVIRSRGSLIPGMVDGLVPEFVEYNGCHHDPQENPKP